MESLFSVRTMSNNFSRLLIRWAVSTCHQWCDLNCIYQLYVFHEFQQTVIGISVSLTHWGRVTHICVGNLTIIGPDNGLSPGRRQAIIWTNPGILLIGPWGTNFSEILIGIHTFSFKKIHLRMSSAKWRPFCLGLNVLTHLPLAFYICLAELSHHWFESWPVACSAANHYLNQRWLLIDENPRNPLQWKKRKGTSQFSLILHLKFSSVILLPCFPGWEDLK